MIVLTMFRVVAVVKLAAAPDPPTALAAITLAVKLWLRDSAAAVEAP
ncbi:MAG: hypothetical protein ORN25_01585 [Caulobacteraceae bacterium]|nr:hypothetical protein [Caulobacteraceae bacterium]